MNLSNQLRNPEHEAHAIAQALRHTDIHVEARAETKGYNK